MNALSLYALLLSGAAMPLNPCPTPTPPDDTPAAPRTLNTPHLPAAPGSRAAWEARRRTLRTQILVSAGLLPMPDKTPLHPRVTGRVEGDDYTIENVAIETRPGFYVGGNLFRPKGKTGLCPAIVVPHGHWAHGRLEMEEDVPRAAPAPAPKGAGRGNLVAIGVNLARHGFVVFAYDAVGYNDTDQVPHTFAGNLKAWLWGTHLEGLQLWNSLRAVDYVESLPYVDKKRIGATGASGGGSQTFLLAAVDDRIQAAVPVNMVSHTMQGGCLCENAPALRVGTDNVEIAALFAPKPLLLVAATGDWTVQTPTVEAPAVRRVYDLYGAGEWLGMQQFNYQHNYNIESREAMCAWFGRWFLGDSNPEHFRERPFTHTPESLRVWNAAHPRPADALSEEPLLAAMRDETTRRLAALSPADPRRLKAFETLMRPALSASLGVELPAPAPPVKSAKRGFLLVRVEGEPAADTTRLAERLAPLGDVRTLVLPPNRETPVTLWTAYFTTYNRTTTGERVQRILEAMRGMTSPEGAGRLDVVGVGSAGLAVLLARALAPGQGATVADMGYRSPETDDDYIAKCYAPCLRGVGGLETAALLLARQPLCLNGGGASLAAGTLEKAFVAGGGILRREAVPLDADALTDWLRKTAPAPR